MVRRDFRGAVAAAMLLFAPVQHYYIPKSSLAGILMLSAWKLVDHRKQLRLSSEDHARSMRPSCC